MDFSDSDESPPLSGTFDLFNHEIELPAIDNQPARRLSMEEDYFYEQVMTFAQPLQPPAYHAATHGTYEGPSRKGKETVLDDNVMLDQELLPAYSCDVHMETVFQMKMEIEDAVKRAEYRNWRTMFVELHGTALHIYSAKKKDFGWGKSRMHGPDVKPDNPSWLRKGSLERSYSLQHADVGIAADYQKYVPSLSPNLYSFSWRNWQQYTQIKSPVPIHGLHNVCLGSTLPHLATELTHPIDDVTLFELEQRRINSSSPASSFPHLSSGSSVSLLLSM